MKAAGWAKQGDGTRLLAILLGRGRPTSRVQERSLALVGQLQPWAGKMLPLCVHVHCGVKKKLSLAAVVGCCLLLLLSVPGQCPGQCALAQLGAPRSPAYTFVMCGQVA
jgi:hypothetical protein